MASFSYIKPPIKYEVHEALHWLRLRYDFDTKIRWSHGRKRGIYLSKDNVILLGDKMNDHLDSLLHQVAHIIVKTECLEPERHGIKFLETLWKVVLEYYHDPSKFTWWGETEEIYSFGKIRTKQWLADKEWNQ